MGHLCDQYNASTSALFTSRRRGMSTQALVLLATGLAALRISATLAQPLDDCSSFDTVTSTGLLLTSLVGSAAGSCAVDMALNPTPDYPAISNSFVKTLTVWTSASALAGIEVTLFNGAVIRHGSTSPCTLEPRQRFWGGGYMAGSEADRLAPFPSPVQSAVECQARCSADPACATFSYDATTGSCYRLRSRFMGATSDTDGAAVSWLSGSCPGAVQGCTVCNASTGGDTYTFQRGETLQTLSLWAADTTTATATANTTASILTGLTFTTSTPGKNFSARATGSSSASKEYPQPVGSGIIAGLYGRYSGMVEALGLAFVPALAEPPFISGVRLVPRAGTEGMLEAQMAAPAYAVSQLCAGPSAGGSVPSLACQSTAVQTWKSQQTLFVTQSIGLEPSVEVRGNVSALAFRSGATVSGLVGNASFRSNAVATISSRTVGLAGLVTVPKGKTTIISSTVRLVRLRAVYWTGRITLRTTAGATLYVAVDGTYDLTLVTQSCSEAVTQGSLASKCKCGGSCGQQVRDVFRPVGPNSLPFAPYAQPPYLLTLPISETDQSPLKPFVLSSVKLMSSPSKKSSGGYQQAAWISAPSSSSSSASSSATPTFVKVLTAASDMPAFLYITVHDVAEVFVNGELVAAVAGEMFSQYYDMMTMRQPTRVQLRRGDNTLAIRCTRTADSSGSGSGSTSGSGAPELFVSILDSGNNYGGKQLAVTDSSWKVLSAPPPYVSGVAVLGPAGAGPWGSANIGTESGQFPDTSAQWIWTAPSTTSSSSSTSSSGDALPVFFKTLVSGSFYDTTATLDIMVSDLADVFVNGQYLATVSGGWRPGEEYGADRPVTVPLRQGANLVAVRCRSFGGGVPGLLASMTVFEDDGSTRVAVRTDATWSVVMQALPEATVLGAPQMHPWHLAPAPCGQQSPFLDAQAAWIWSQPLADADASPDLSPTFWKTISLPAPQTASLYVAADDSVDVLLNGAVLATVSGAAAEAAATPMELPLATGANVLALRASNADGGPAGVLASLVSAADSRRVLARTDGTWTFTLAGPAFSECRPPNDWCNGAGQTLQPVDCDRDGLADWSCADTATGRVQSVIMSSAGCVPLQDWAAASLMCRAAR